MSLHSSFLAWLVKEQYEEEAVTDEVGWTYNMENVITKRRGEKGDCVTVRIVKGVRG